MKNIILLSLLFIIVSCSTEKTVYWCGDHPCINKKERKAYFEKTMIVEVKKSKKKNSKNTSYIEKLLQEAKIKENKRIKSEKILNKQSKLEEKRLIKEEKKLAKQKKLEEKRLIKEEKKLAKQVKLDENKIFKNESKLFKKKAVKKLNKNTEIKMKKFNDLVEKIIKKNAFRSYPDINDMQN